MISVQPNKGVLLIAEPSIIGDVSFNRSVVLLAEHSDTGSVGFILNKESDYTIDELIPEIEKSMLVYKGGPVEEDNLYFIHKIPELVPNSIEISNGIYWAGDFTVISKLIQDDKIGEDDIRFFLGYSGWESQQLMDELSSNAWVVVENEDANEIISKKSASFWKDKMTQLGGEYLIWSNAPENPSNN